MFFKHFKLIESNPNSIYSSHSELLFFITILYSITFWLVVILGIHKYWVSLILENMSLGTVFNISKSQIIKWWEIWSGILCAKNPKTHPLILWYLIIVFLIQYMRWIWCKFKYYLKLFSLVPDWENRIFFINLLLDWSLLLFKYIWVIKIDCILVQYTIILIVYFTSLLST